MEISPPCEMCRQRQHPCTFARGPGIRTRPNNQPRQKDGSSQEVQHQQLNESSGLNEHLLYQDAQGLSNQNFGLNIDPNLDDMFGIFDYDIQFDHVNSPNHTQEKLPSMSGFGRETTQQMSPRGGMSGSFHSSTSHATNSSPSLISQPSPTIQSFNPQASLEKLSGASSRFIGFTGELDLYLLRHRQYDENNQSSSQYTNIVYRRMSGLPSSKETETMHSDQNESDFLPPQIFTIMEDKYTDKAEPRLDSTTMEQLEREFRDLINSEVAVSLIRLYYRFVDPYFPIMSTSQFPTDIENVKSIPVSLLAAVCATAVPFIIYDDDLCVQLPRAPSVSQLFRISWLALSNELHTPKLSTIQARLLMLQRHATEWYVADSPFKWTLTGIVVGAAQNLGLNRDPRGWTSLPLWERALRKRLWWALYVMEKWTSLGHGMPTHLHESDCDVDLLAAEDFEIEPSDPRETSGLNSHFYHLTTLTIILSDIVSTYYTVRGVKTTANNFQLSLDLAKAARAKLKDWQDHLPSHLRNRGKLSSNGAPRENSLDMCELDGNASLHLAYIVTQMTLFRALLRPISNWSLLSSNSSSQIEFEGAQAVITGAITCIRELVEFIESLTGTEWDAFWHSCELHPTTSSISTNDTSIGSRHNFAIASTFLMQLLFIVRIGQAATPTRNQASDLADQPSVTPSSATSDQYTALQNLVRRWRWAMRVSARGAGGNKGLMNLSLLRIDALFTEWQKGSGYGVVPKIP